MALTAPYDGDRRLIGDIPWKLLQTPAERRLAKLEATDALTLDVFKGLLFIQKFLLQRVAPDALAEDR